MNSLTRIVLLGLTLMSFAAAEPEGGRAPWNVPIPGQLLEVDQPEDPKKSYTVEIVGLEEGEPVLIIKKQGEIWFKEPAMGYLLDMHWSPDGGHLAINERTANSGDYLWVLDLKARRVLKRPDDKTWRAMESKGVAALEAKALGKWGKEAESDRSWGTAVRWEDETTLVANVAVRFLNAKVPPGESSVLNEEIKLHVKPEGISLTP